MCEIVKIGCMPLSSSIHYSFYTSMIAFVAGYKVNFFVEHPSEINISPDLQLMNASAVVNQSLPTINGCPPKLFLRVKIINSTGYSQESKDT